ncbi:MAG: hypothetical protein H6650_11195 [Ardenticatenales bacterium]|nr:hypothetical protein [Ardenticatenales bacterium]
MTAVPPSKMIFPEASSRMMALGNSFREDVVIDGGAPWRMRSPSKMIFPEASSRMMALGNSFREDVVIDGGAPWRMRSPLKIMALSDFAGSTPHIWIWSEGFSRFLRTYSG